MSIRSRRDCPSTRAYEHAVPGDAGVAANQIWAVDFIRDSLISGRHFRAFAVLDQWSRESLAIVTNVSSRVCGLPLKLIELWEGNGYPKIYGRLRCDWRKLAIGRPLPG